METMVEPASREQLNRELAGLPREAIADVAQYIHEVKRRYERSVEPNGRRLLKYAGMWDKETVQAAADAIEEGCEQVDPDGW